MAKVRDDKSYWATLASARLYKPNQGRLVRQVTAVALAVIVLAGVWQLRNTVLAEAASGIAIGLPTALGALGLWAIYRLVNWPVFADFLVSVEAEMDKVSWADWGYLQRATGVVLGTMLVLGVYLFVCDIFWQQFFDFIGFLNLEAMESQ